MDEHTLITVTVQGLAYEPVRNHLFRLELDKFEQEIVASEQDNFSMRQAHVISSDYRPPRRQETGGREPMDLRYVKTEIPRSRKTSDCRSAISVKSSGTMHVSVVW